MVRGQRIRFTPAATMAFAKRDTVTGVKKRGPHGRWVTAEDLPIGPVVERPISRPAMDH